LLVSTHVNADFAKIHRHHKRTPYAANTFPHESYSWDCSDEGLFYYGKPLNPTSKPAASTYWSLYSSSVNPFAPSGFNGTCQFPKITRGGLEDSWQHGKDLFGVYHDLLHFLPDQPDDTTSWRVTNNVITSQVAGMIVNAMYPGFTSSFPLQIQPASVDSLEPAYSCPAATWIYANYSVGSKSPSWTTHLNASSTLFASLDAVSGVARNDTGFH
jgi:2-phosphoxylose phosphatase